ncbi:WD40 repeat domain-containing serine/threonine protein kinase [Actinomadura rubrisoli]|nr:serine/threonine-protein kinase [Actinomadura rubrisoli]
MAEQIMGEGRGRLIAHQYRLVEEIGRGGFGVVWRARDERLNRDVAAKELFLPLYLAADQREERRERSMREARSAARIMHPSAVTVHAVVEQDGVPWIIMELIDGRSLGSVVRSGGPLPPRRAAEIGLGVLGALRTAHAAGVVHRDVTPGNILLAEGRAVLTDFGIATIEGDPSITSSGYLMGAPAYTAPERARGEHATPASDLWSLGATLYLAVEGKRPFAGDNANAVLHAIQHVEPDRPVLAGPLGPVIEGLMRKVPADRLSAEQAESLLGDVALDRVPALLSLPPGAGRVQDGRVWRWRRLVAVAAAPVVAAGVVSGLLWADRAGTPESAQGAAGRAAPAAGPRLLATLAAADEVYTVSINAAGTLLAAAGENRAVRLWRLPDRRPVAVLRGHGHAIFASAFSPDGRTLATGGYDREVILWNTAARRRLATLTPGQGTIGSLAFSPDGRELATAGTDDVQLWNVARRARLQVLGRPAETQYSAAFSRLGWLAFASADTLRMWRSRAAPRSATLGGVSSLVRAMAFDPTGRVVAIGGDDGTVTLWDCAARRRLGTVPHDRSVYAVAFSPDGRTLATASGDTVVLWDVAQRKRTATLTGHRGLVSSLAFSRDGRTLASGGFDGTVRLWALGP